MHPEFWLILAKLARAPAKALAAHLLPALPFLLMFGLMANWGFTFLERRLQGASERTTP